MTVLRRRRILRATVPLAGLAVLVLGIAVAQGAFVRVNGFTLTAEGSYKPQRLPRGRFAPIEFHGYAAIHSTTDKPPPQLLEATLEFDRDGRLQTKGLPICPAERIEHIGSEAARRVCKGAIVGTGTVGMTLFFDGAAFPAHAPLTLFNGPPSGGNATVNAQVFVAAPVNQTYVVPVTIERIHGEYSYRAHFNTPALAGGGLLTRVEAKVGRRYKSGGRELSYVSARCRDRIFKTHGNFVFADGTIIDGSVEKGCIPENF